MSWANQSHVTTGLIRSCRGQQRAVTEGWSAAASPGHIVPSGRFSPAAANQAEPSVLWTCLFRGGFVCTARSGERGGVLELRERGEGRWIHTWTFYCVLVRKLFSLLFSQMLALEQKLSIPIRFPLHLTGACWRTCCLRCWQLDLALFLKREESTLLFVLTEADCKPPDPYPFQIPFILSSPTPLLLKVTHLTLFHLHFWQSSALLLALELAWGCVWEPWWAAAGCEGKMFFWWVTDALPVIEVCCLKALSEFLGHS